MTWVAVCTPVASVEDFELVGPFKTKDEAMDWMHNAFHRARWENYLFRVKELKSPK